MTRIQEVKSRLQWGFRRLVGERSQGPTGAPARALAVIWFIAVLTGLGAPASAQMKLPGAIGGGTPTSDGERPSGGGEGSGAPSAYAPPKPVAMKPPAGDTIAGRVMNRDGAKGTMLFEKTGGEGLALSKLALEGEVMSKPGKTCKVDVALASPLAAVPVRRPAGAIRYQVPVAACPFTIDILDGAVLVTTPDPTCDFAAADCRVIPGGLWGPTAADISAKQAKDLEHERQHLETTMRTNFRVLLRKAGRDRNAVKAIAKEQAAFSSEREMTCRDYQQETVHGFCSTRITQARALALMAQFGPVLDGSRGRARTAAPHTAKDSRPTPDESNP